jgi:tetratricopeptide (TPR) repeat protein
LPPPPAAGTLSAAAPSSPQESPASKLSGLPAAAPASPAALPAPAQAKAPATVPPAAPAVPPAQVAAAPDAPPVQQAAPRSAPPRVKVQRADPVESRMLDEDGIETVVLRPSPRAAARAEVKEVRPATETAPAVAPDIARAYEALQAGDNAQARTLYAEILRNDPKNVDALLGSAAIAWKEGQADEAAHFFQRVLELEPRNAYAQAGLISMLGSADPAASESRLRQLIAREPSAFLYFTLGNLYADQGQWPAAQQAYFQAYQSQPDNPDYAFNLAVGLEHLGQTRHALDYYRKALDLSFRKGRANFDQGLVIQRVGQLSSRVGQ